MRDLGVEGVGGAVVANQREHGIALGQIQCPGVAMRFDRNAEIFGAGEAAEYLYKVVSGAVRTVRFSADGRRQIMAFHMAGDTFGLERGAQHEYSAESVTDCELIAVRRSLVQRAAAENIGAAQALLQLSVSQLERAQEHVLLLGRKGAGERVAGFLLGLADRFTVRGELDLPMSRLDIADYLALTIETVSRAFTQMERDHAIELPSSRHVVVCNRGALEMLQAA
ncbi:helix-turn-helix domain-containing protein [Terricaulis sp.]|uniref:helix-turn-helix domain-containing protein n=1 Tax=Terricaulis sp. TaxID=2768686 RepID=UPI003784BE05